MPSHHNECSSGGGALGGAGAMLQQTRSVHRKKRRDGCSSVGEAEPRPGAPRTGAEAPNSLFSLAGGVLWLPVLDGLARSMRDPMLVQTLANRASRDESLYSDGTELAEKLRQAISANEVDAMSILLSPIKPLTDICKQIEQMSTNLLRLAIRSGDACECALYLLLFLEEVRREKEQQAEPAAKRPKISGSESFAERNRLLREERKQIIARREGFCHPAPAAPELLSLASEALAPLPGVATASGGAGVATPAAPRCGRALLLQAHRLRKQKPRANKPLLDVDFEQPLRDSNGQPSVAWPGQPTDLPPSFLPNGGIGGFDLSLGGEAVPLQWVNETDFSTPPPVVFVRRCMDVDVRPDWAKTPARCCSSQKGTSVIGGIGTSGGSLGAEDRCRYTNFKSATGLPGAIIECNWACDEGQTCDPQCSRRAMQRGGGHRLQVFKDPNKGWCLRTLSRIRKDEFIMEYVAERISMTRGEERVKDTPDIETYLMDVQTYGGKQLELDALIVRNHAAYAAFTCSTRFRNMKKQRFVTSHWDPRVPQVGFVATRDIEPGEELTYFRTDEEPKIGTSHQTCGCRKLGCTRRI